MITFVQKLLDKNLHFFVYTFLDRIEGYCPLPLVKNKAQYEKSSTRPMKKNTWMDATEKWARSANMASDPAYTPNQDLCVRDSGRIDMEPNW